MKNYKKKQIKLTVGSSICNTAHKSYDFFFSLAFLDAVQIVLPSLPSRLLLEWTGKSHNSLAP